MAITVRFLADIGDWLKGLGKSETALDDNAKGLEELMRQAIELGRSIGKSTDEIARDFSEAFGIPLDRARSAVEEATRDVSQLEDATKDAGKAGEKAGEDLSDGMKEAGDDVEDVAGKVPAIGDNLTELGQLAKDVLSGDFGSAAESALSVLTGLAAAAGIGGAVGSALGKAFAGLVGSLAEELTRLAEHSKETTEGIISDFVEFGDALDQKALETKVKAIFGDEDTRRQAELLARLLGTDLPTAVLAMAGDFEAAAVEVDQVISAIAKAPGDVRLDDWEMLKATMSGITEGLEQGPRYADAYSDAMTRVSRRAAEAEVAAGAASKSIDDLGQTVYMMPDGKVIVIDAETRRARADIESIDDYKLDLKTQGIHVDDDQALKDLLNIDRLNLNTKTIRIAVDDTAWRNWNPEIKEATVRATPGIAGWASRWQ